MNVSAARLNIALVGQGFARARDALRRSLKFDNVIVCNPTDLPSGSPPIDVVIPLGLAVDRTLLAAVRPRLVHQFGTGLDSIDLAAARDLGIPVANVPGAASGSAAAVAEIAILHTLALFRRLRDAEVALRCGKVGGPSGRGLRSAHVVILGYGAIGRAIAERIRPFVAGVTAVGRRVWCESANRSELDHIDGYFQVGDLTSALSGRDVLYVTLPLSAETSGLIGRAELAKLAVGGYLINVSRAAVVDRNALYEALESGQLAGAGLDVFWDEPVDSTDPIFQLNVSGTPHVGGAVAGVHDSIANCIARNVERLRSGESIQHRVV